MRAVVYQSVSGRAAGAIFARLKEVIGRPLTPAKVFALRPQSLVKAGLSNAKARTIRNLASWFKSNRELAAALPKLSDEEINDALSGIPGVGPWTINVFLIFNLGRLDVMPAADLGIRRGVQLIDGLRTLATPKQVIARSEVWRPYRSIASIYLWQAVRLKVESNDLDYGKADRRTDGLPSSKSGERGGKPNSRPVGDE